MSWQVEFTDEFEEWWISLTEAEQISVDASVRLLGGDKTGDTNWYERNVPIADSLYDAHLEELKREGLIDG